MVACEGGVFVVEAEAEAEHEEIGVLELLEAVADVEECGAGDGNFEVKHLVESFEILSVVEDVAAQTDAYGENGHDELYPSGGAKGNLFVRRGIGKAVFLAWIPSCVFVGTCVIHNVQRSAHAEFVTGIVHGTDTCPEYGVCVGGMSFSVIVIFFASP